MEKQDRKKKKTREIGGLLEGFVELTSEEKRMMAMEEGSAMRKEEQTMTGEWRRSEKRRRLC